MKVRAPGNAAFYACCVLQTAAVIVHDHVVIIFMSQHDVHMTASAKRTPCLKSISLVFFDAGLVSILAVICNHVTDLGARGILRRRQLQLGEARRFPKVNRGLVSLASFSPLAARSGGMS